MNDMRVKLRSAAPAEATPDPAAENGLPESDSGWALQTWTASC